VLEVFASVEKRPALKSYTGYGKRLPSDQPPVLTPKELGFVSGSDTRSLSQGNGQGREQVGGEHEG
jgi:cell division protease FtsH